MSTTQGKVQSLIAPYYWQGCSNLIYFILQYVLVQFRSWPYILYARDRPGSTHGHWPRSRQLETCEAMIHLPISLELDRQRLLLSIITRLRRCLTVHSSLKPRKFVHLTSFRQHQIWVPGTLNIFENCTTVSKSYLDGDSAKWRQ
jgi:hypothetical protein